MCLKEQASWTVLWVAGEAVIWANWEEWDRVVCGKPLGWRCSTILARWTRAVGGLWRGDQGMEDSSRHRAPWLLLHRPAWPGHWVMCVTIPGPWSFQWQQTRMSCYVIYCPAGLIRESRKRHRPEMCQRCSDVFGFWWLNSHICVNIKHSFLCSFTEFHSGSCLPSLGKS